MVSLYIVPQSSTLGSAQWKGDAKKAFSEYSPQEESHAVYKNTPRHARNIKKIQWAAFQEKNLLCTVKFGGGSKAQVLETLKLRLA